MFNENGSWSLITPAFRDLIPADTMRGDHFHLKNNRLFLDATRGISYRLFLYKNYKPFFKVKDLRGFKSLSENKIFHMSRNPSLIWEADVSQRKYQIMISAAFKDTALLKDSVVFKTLVNVIKYHRFFCRVIQFTSCNNPMQYSYALIWRDSGNKFDRKFK